MAEFLTFAAQEMLIKVVSLAAQEFTVIRDAEHPKQDQGVAVKLWLEKLEVIAHHVDDVLDDYGYELLRRKVELQNQIKKKVQ
ncbi:hypothetical protein M0R45_029085 [Rubus argutus]|uniref:Disease resistance N-terminal domain-containing protein n=1 Tax=Rubus argutus TaxID=59490 RepID=A0AAW1W9A5_RUBAR